MPLYTLYPSRADGGSMSFTALDLRDDGHARTAAQALLAEHASAVEVVIWQGERRVGAVSRIAEPAA